MRQTPPKIRSLETSAFGVGELNEAGPDLAQLALAPEATPATKSSSLLI